MTLDEFYRELVSIGGVWHSSPTYNMIRNEKRECPICAVSNAKCGTNFRNNEVTLAAYSLDLAFDYKDIVLAADDDKNCDKNIRVKLLQLTRCK